MLKVAILFCIAGVILAQDFNIQGSAALNGNNDWVQRLNSTLTGLKGRIEQGKAEFGKQLHDSISHFQQNGRQFAEALRQREQQLIQGIRQHLAGCHGHHNSTSTTNSTGAVNGTVSIAAQTRLA